MSSVLFFYETMSKDHRLMLKYPAISFDPISSTTYVHYSEKKKFMHDEMFKKFAMLFSIIDRPFC